MYNVYMGSFSMNKCSFEQLKQELATYRIGHSSYSFDGLQRVIEMRGWTLKEYNLAHEQELMVEKLKGNNA